MSDRLSVFKTYKLYVGGKFPRSESGRVYEVTDSKGNWLANAPQSSRKDARDAVVAARKAFGGYQESGFGREGGRHGLLAYLDLGS